MKCAKYNQWLKSAIHSHMRDRTVKLSHGKKPRVWTAQRICTSSRARAADDPCSHCSLVPVASVYNSDANSITKHQWEPLSWRLFNIARDWFHEPLFLGRTWVVPDESNYRMSDWKEVSLFERTSDWSLSILSRKSKERNFLLFFFLLLSWYTQSCVLLHTLRNITFRAPFYLMNAPLQM